jgi:hypothetical protein
MARQKLSWANAPMFSTSAFNCLTAMVRAGKVKKEQTHQDEGDDRNIFSEKVNHGEADVLLNN